MGKAIFSNLSNEMNKELTRQCKSIGYKRSDVLGYLADNPDIVGDICYDLLRADNLVEIIQVTTGIDMTNRGIRIPVNTDKSLSDTLKKYNITVSSFLYYIITNNIINAIELPEELKMVKYR